MHPDPPRTELVALTCDEALLLKEAALALCDRHLQDATVMHDCDARCDNLARGRDAARVAGLLNPAIAVLRQPAAEAA